MIRNIYIVVYNDNNFGKESSSPPHIWQRLALGRPASWRY